MPFIGNQPALSYTSFAKQDFTTSATTSYTLDHPVTNENEIALFINFVRQEAGTAYTASNTTLTLSSATSASDDMYAIFLGKAIQTVNPPNSSVGSSQVSADLITGQTALGATPADTDELLISDAGTLKRVDYSYLKSTNTPAFEAVIGTNQTISNATETKVTFQTENFDTDGAYDNSTNYRFTPQTAGKYYCYTQVRPVTGSSNTTQYVLLRFKKNGTMIAQSQISTYPNADLDSPSITHGRVFTLNGSTDYIEVFVLSEGGGSMTLQTNSTENPNVFGAYKLIGV